MDSIYKTPHGNHIDLSKLISITDACFIDKMGRGGYFVGFTMEFQLMDGPIVFERDVPFDQWDGSGMCFSLMMKDGLFHDYRPETNESEIKSVHDLQIEVDEIISAWRLFTAPPEPGITI